MDIKGKTAIITGGVSGLGEATARLFAERGANVAIFDLQDDRGAALIDDLGSAARYYKIDVADEEAVTAAVANVQSEFGGIHICCNYAGIGSAERTLGKDGPHSLASFRRVIEVNLIGTFNVLRLASQAMAGNEPVTPDGQRGVIINTASIAAFEGQVGQAAYSASKGGVVGMMLPIARDLARDGIRCNTIVPGLIHTPLFDTLEPSVYQSLERSALNPSRLGRPEEIARTALYIVENDYLNAESIRVDAGIRMQPR